MDKKLINFQQLCFNYFFKPIKNQQILNGKISHYLYLLIGVLAIQLQLLAFSYFTNNSQIVTIQVPSEVTKLIEQCQNTNCNANKLVNNKQENFYYSPNLSQININQLTEPGYYFSSSGIIVVENSQKKLFTISKISNNEIVLKRESNDLTLNFALLAVIAFANFWFIVIVIMIILMIFKLIPRFRKTKVKDYFKIVAFSTNLSLFGSLIVYGLINQNYVLSQTMFISVLGITSFLNLFYIYLRNTPEDKKRLDEKSYL